VVVADKRHNDLRYLKKYTNFIWILDKKEESDPLKDRFTMPLNPDSASDIAKISQYLPCLVMRRLSRPFLFKKKAVNILDP
jgi:hypothetical protein